MYGSVHLPPSSSSVSPSPLPPPFINYRGNTESLVNSRFPTWPEEETEGYSLSIQHKFG